jgi:predicted RNA-binding Zn ribbon-like protein
VQGYRADLHLSRAEYWCYLPVMPATLSPTRTPPFRFIGGDLSLDLINTVDWTDRGPAHERLSDYLAMVEWAVAAGALDAAAAGRLRRLAAARPREAARAHTHALRVRAQLRDLMAGGPEAAAARRALNPLLGDALGRLALAPAAGGAGRMRWEWTGLDTRLDAVLWPVLRSAAELLVSDEADRIRTCGGPDCGWIYVDRSRNGLRRWCQMRTCGTREKSRRRRVGP